MNKVIKYSIFLALLISLSTAAQNTASISGNWDDCTTWGTPATLFNNTTDTKTINTSVNVTQNTAWSTNNVNFGTGNGSISFADNAKSIDFVTDAGNDKTCVCPTAPVVTNITNFFSGDPTTCCGWTSKKTTIAFNLVGTNLGTKSWAIAPSSGVAPASGTANGTGPINFNSPGDYTITYTIAGTGSCTTSTTIGSKNITLVVNDDCAGVIANWIKSAGAANSPYCGIQLNTGESVAGGVMTRTFATIVGKIYNVYFVDKMDGFGNSSGIYRVASSSNTTLASNAYGPGNSELTFTFTAQTTSTTMSITGTGNTSGSNNNIMNVQVYTVN